MLSKKRTGNAILLRMVFFRFHLLDYCSYGGITRPILTLRSGFYCGIAQTPGIDLFWTYMRKTSAIQSCPEKREIDCRVVKKRLS